MPVATHRDIFPEFNKAVRAWREWESQASSGDEEEAQRAFLIFDAANSAWVRALRAFQFARNKHTGDLATPHKTCGGEGSGTTDALLVGEVQRLRACGESLVDIACGVRIASATPSQRLLTILSSLDTQGHDCCAGA
jgi:hypothetical protein